MCMKRVKAELALTQQYNQADKVVLSQIHSFSSLFSESTGLSNGRKNGKSHLFFHLPFSSFPIIFIKKESVLFPLVPRCRQSTLDNSMIMENDPDDDDDHSRRLLPSRFNWLTELIVVIFLSAQWQWTTDRPYSLLLLLCFSTKINQLKTRLAMFSTLKSLAVRRRFPYAEVSSALCVSFISERTKESFRVAMCTCHWSINLRSAVERVTMGIVLHRWWSFILFFGELFLRAYKTWQVTVTPTIVSTRRHMIYLSLHMGIDSRLEVSIEPRKMNSEIVFAEPSRWRMIMMMMMIRVRCSLFLLLLRSPRSFLCPDRSTMTVSTLSRHYGRKVVPESEGKTQSKQREMINGHTDTLE